ncbi:MAG: riboflavin synthase [Candidatus Nanohaloarchaea archaeon]
MFTGIVEDTAEVEDISEAGEGKRIELVSSLLEQVSQGDSVSVSGACLTVEETRKETAEFFLAKETLERTWFDRLEKGDELNVETSLSLNDTLDGHIVQGHVDASAEILEIEELEEGWNFTLSKPDALKNYVVEKGFIAVEGVSLTVTSENPGEFTATIIPETWKRTSLSTKKEGDHVNLEADITARYIQKMHRDLRPQ